MSKAGSLFELQKKEEDRLLSIKIVLQSNIKLKQKLKKTGIINANDFFKDRYKLSLKSGKFLVFENIDQHPLFINNFGMASKLYRYIYSDKILPLKYFKKQPAGMGMTRHMGYYGQQILLQEDEKLPLIGQIATGKDKRYQGVTILENNLYRVPAFYHKPKHSDFI